MTSRFTLSIMDAELIERRRTVKKRSDHDSTLSKSFVIAFRQPTNRAAFCVRGNRHSMTNTCGQGQRTLDAIRIGLKGSAVDVGCRC